MKTAIELIAEERRRQIEVEGWTPEHDSNYHYDELARAAASYALPEESRHGVFIGDKPEHWPWESKWWKPTPDDRIRELTKAGALIVAEIDRLLALKQHKYETDNTGN